MVLRRPFHIGGFDGAIDQPALLLQLAALEAQGLRHGESFAMQQALDLLERDADEFQGDDLFQAIEVAECVDAIAGIGSLGAQETKAVVVMESFDCNAGEGRRVVHLIELTQPVPLLGC